MRTNTPFLVTLPEAARVVEVDVERLPDKAGITVKTVIAFRMLADQSWEPWTMDGGPDPSKAWCVFYPIDGHVESETGESYAELGMFLDALYEIKRSSGQAEGR